MVRALCALFSAALVCLQAPAASAYTRGNLFVTNRGGNNILEFRTSDLTLVRTWFNGSGMVGPNGMAFDPMDHLFVADTSNDRIMHFDPNGAMMGSFSTQATLGSYVESIIFDRMGRLWATANAGLGRVVRYERDGSMPFTLVNDRQFLNLGNVNFTPAGNVLVSNFNPMTSGVFGIRELDVGTGAIVRTVGSPTGQQEDMVVDAAGSIWVSAFNQNSVYRFDPMGRHVTEFMRAGLIRPTGIVLTQECHVIVASFGSNELYEFLADGTFVRSATAVGLMLPESLAIAGLTVAGSISLSIGTPDCTNRPDPDAGATVDAAISSDAPVAPADAVREDASAPDSAVVFQDGTMNTRDTGAVTRDGGNGVGDAGCACRSVAPTRPRQSRLTTVLFGMLAIVWGRRQKARL